MPLISYIFFFFKYDRNSNLNSHTLLFWRSQGSNPHLHRGVGLLKEGDYHRTEYPSDFNFNLNHTKSNKKISTIIIIKNLEVTKI